MICWPRQWHLEKPRWKGRSALTTYLLEQASCSVAYCVLPLLLIQEAALAQAQDDHKAQVDALQAKLAEAAGVLNAKEDLREAR